MLTERLSDLLDDPMAMRDALVRHNDAVRATIPAQGSWSGPPAMAGPDLRAAGLDVPDSEFPSTNDANRWRADLGMPPID